MTPEQIAEFEAACDLRQLRRDNPMPGLPTVDQAIAIVRHALIGYSTARDGELACTAGRAAAHAVQALRGAYLLHLAGPDIHPHRTPPSTDRPGTAPAAITHERPTSARSIREALAGFPSWMADECITWTRAREAMGCEFSGGKAAAQHWLDEQTQGG